MSEAELLQRAKNAVKAGDKGTAQRFLLQVIKQNPRSGTAWLWLSAIVDDPIRERDCLEQVLRINPNSEVAKRHLDRLREEGRSRPISSNIAKVIVVALVDGILIGLLGFCALGIVMAIAGMSLTPMLVFSLLIMLTVVGYHFVHAQSELDKTGNVSIPKTLVSYVVLEKLGPVGEIATKLLKGLVPIAGFVARLLAAFLEGAISGSRSGMYSARDPNEMLPSGYTRAEYYAYGATDEDIEFWGLYEPGAPGPRDAGWVVMEMVEELDRDGDGFIDW